MHIAAAQPQHLGPAQPGPRHQQHDQPVPRRAARPEHREMSASAARSTGRSGSCSRCRARIRQDIPASSPRAAPGRSRSSATSYNSGTRCPLACPAATACTTIARTAISTALIRRAPRTGAVPGPASTIPAPAAASAPGPAGQRAPASHEQAELLDPRLPGPARPGAPPQEQRDRARVRPRRRLRAIPAEPHLPQKRVRDRHDSQIPIQNRPVPRPDGNLTGKARIPDPPDLAELHQQLPATSTAPEETRRRTLSNAASRQRHATGCRPPENPVMIGLSLAITASALAPRRAVASCDSRFRIRRSASLLGLVSSLPR